MDHHDELGSTLALRKYDFKNQTPISKAGFVLVNKWPDRIPRQCRGIYIRKSVHSRPHNPGGSHRYLYRALWLTTDDLLRKYEYTPEVKVWPFVLPNLDVTRRLPKISFFSMSSRLSCSFRQQRRARYQCLIRNEQFSSSDPSMSLF